MKFVDEASLYVKAVMVGEVASASEEKSSYREAGLMVVTEEKGET